MKKADVKSRSNRPVEKFRSIPIKGESNVKTSRPITNIPLIEEMRRKMGDEATVRELNRRLASADKAFSNRDPVDGTWSDPKPLVSLAQAMKIQASAKRGKTLKQRMMKLNKLRRFKVRLNKPVRRKTPAPGMKARRARSLKVASRRRYTVFSPRTYVGSRVFDRSYTRYVGYPETTNATYDTGNTVVVFGGSKSGASNPNWKALVKQGANASNVFAAERTTQKNVRADYNVAYRLKGTGLDQQTGYRFTGYFSGKNLLGAQGTYAGGPGLSQQADDNAIKRLHKAIERRQHQFQGGVFVAELHKAVKMVVKPAKSLRDAMTQYAINARKRTKGIKSPIKAKKVLAGLYLEATFGWQPLIHDVEDAAKALARFNYPKAEKSRFKVAGEGEESAASAGFQFDSYISTLAWNYVLALRSQATTVFYGVFRGGVTDVDTAVQSASRLVALSGFDLRSFVPTVWEVIPFSFVVDYFSNVGDVLQAYTHCSGIAQNLTMVKILETNNLSSFTPDIAKIYQQLQVNYNVRPSTHEIFLQVHPISSNSSYRSVNRSLPGSIPMPTLRFELPGTDNWKQWLNLGALYTALKS